MFGETISSHWPSRKFCAFRRNVARPRRGYGNSVPVSTALNSHGGTLAVLTHSRRSRCGGSGLHSRRRAWAGILFVRFFILVLMLLLLAWTSNPGN